MGMPAGPRIAASRRNLDSRVLNLIRKKYSGSEEERFGPTLAAEHLAEEDGIVLDHETLRLWMLADGAGSGSARNTANEGSANPTLANWCSWTAVFTIGWKGVVRGRSEERRVGK